MPPCTLCGEKLEVVEGVVPGELDLNLALHRIQACPAIDMSIQKAFLYSDAKLAALSGGFGASKSVTGCVWSVLLANRIPRSEHLVGRLNRPALETTTRSTFLSLAPRVWVEDWVETKGKLIWKNGSVTWFKHLDIADADVKGHIRSMNLTSFLVDQSEETQKGTFLTLIGRLRRQTDPLAHFGRLLLNPNGQDWNWDMFFNTKRKESWKKNIGLTVATTDNAKNLPPDYIQNMLDNYPADWSERFIKGSFAEFGDQIYKDFSVDMHVWEEADWTPPLDWPVIVGIDIGGVDPWAIGFWAVMPQTGILFKFDEIYQAGILVADIAAEYHRIMEGRTLDGLAYDYENQQAALELGEFQIGGTPAIKEVKPGIFKMQSYLHPSEKVPHFFKSMGKTDPVYPGPRMYFSSKCVNSIREYQSYKWAKNRQDEFTEEPDHACSHSPDSDRYAVHTFRPEPARLLLPKNYESKELTPHSRLYWHRAAIHKQDEEKQKQSPFVRSPFRTRNRMLSLPRR
jgi:hypothetical protein